MEVQTEAKWPIVNGSFNRSLTIEDALQFNYETKLDLAWYLIVEMGSSYPRIDIDNEVWEPMGNLPEYNVLWELTSDELSERLSELMILRDQHEAKLLRRTAMHRFRLGKEIRKVQGKLGFKGFIEMDGARLRGYIWEMGGWNNMYPAKISQLISKVESLIPGKNYGVNNPNTDTKMHVWSTTGDYITVKFSYLTPDDYEKIVNFYKIHFEDIAREARADSVRMEHSTYDNGHGVIMSYSAELIMWWD